VRQSARVAGETLTQTLHRLTSYEPGRDWDAPADDPWILQDLEANDLERLPWSYKRYEQDLPRIELPDELPRVPTAALSVLAGTAEAAASPLDLPQLARLLFLSAGVVRVAERPGRRMLFRAAGSAGGRFPLEVYVAVPEGGALPPGVHWYDPEAHELVTVAPAPRAAAPAVVITGVPWRTGWRYRERGYRHIYWDAGTLLAQQLALAASIGVEPGLVTRFPDEAVEALVGADGVHELAVAVVSLGGGVEHIEPAGEAARGATDRAPLEFPLVTAAQRAGRLGEWGDPWPPGEPTEAPADGPTLDDVIRRRSSQRLMDPTGSLPRSLLTASMAAAMRGIDVPHWVVVHAVDDMDPGIYRWPNLETPVRAGEFRGELYRVALDQGLPRDAAFVVIAGSRIADLDDRGYREAQLAAGIVEGRLHLAAYAQNAGASGMTFLDSEIRGLLGEDVDGLLFTCVGVPEYTSKAAGKPGEPARFRQVETRLDDGPVPPRSG
jgi:SagB-type dehydrogenase family enzyme